MRKIVILAALLIIVSVAQASAQDMVMVESIDGYYVKMIVLNNNPPVVGANSVLFQLTDASGNWVPNITDIGVTYELSGFMPRRIMPVTNTNMGYSGVMNIYTAASYDVFFVFVRGTDNQRVVRFTFQTRG
jgi:hypothetical protein